MLSFNELRRKLCNNLTEISEATQLKNGMTQEALAAVGGEADFCGTNGTDGNDFVGAIRPSICKGTCDEGSSSWSEKCTWTSCFGCAACHPTAAPTTSAPSLTPTPAPCKTWCDANEAEWSTKCSWGNCAGCDACVPTAAPIPAPSAAPTAAPIPAPSAAPTAATPAPTLFPTPLPTSLPSPLPTIAPTTGDHVVVSVELTISGLNASRVKDTAIAAIKRGVARCIDGVNASDICCVTVTAVNRRRQLGVDLPNGRRLSSSAVVSFGVGMSISESDYDDSEAFGNAVSDSVSDTSSDGTLVANIQEEEAASGGGGTFSSASVTATEVTVETRQPSPLPTSAPSTSPSAATTNDDDGDDGSDGESTGCGFGSPLMNCVNAIGVVPSIGVGFVVTVMLFAFAWRIINCCDSSGSKETGKRHKHGHGHGHGHEVELTEGLSPSDQGTEDTSVRPSAVLDFSENPMMDNAAPGQV